MATEEQQKQAWTDKNTIVSLNSNLEQSLANYNIFFEEFKKFKEEVMDDPERKADLKALIDLLPGWSMNKITTKYTAYKAIYDYLQGE